MKLKAAALSLISIFALGGFLVAANAAPATAQRNSTVRVAADAPTVAVAPDALGDVIWH
ncbi:hypothetical protein GCM10009665_18590 [Kitasatospora nipponensis]|uniref:Uncharacterized protein n=1 Tax=Kitasatospora nipponensis TaxID=258049 RepID=A0ABN1VZJ7_9ACTN